MLGGTTPTGAARSAQRRRSSSGWCRRPSASCTQKQIEGDDLGAQLADIPDIRAWYVNERGERELSFSLLARDGDALNEAVGQLEGALRQVPGFSNVAANGALDRPEIRVVPKLDSAAELGVSPETIAETVRVATIGDVGANLAKFNAGDRLVPIRVQIERAGAHRPGRSSQQPARHQRRRQVACRCRRSPTSSSARGPSSIDRYDRVAPRRDRVDLDARLRARRGARGVPARWSTSRSCRRASRCSRPATPRSRTKWSPASPPPWAPA